MAPCRGADPAIDDAEHLKPIRPPTQHLRSASIRAPTVPACDGTVDTSLTMHGHTSTIDILSAGLDGSAREDPRSPTFMERKDRGNVREQSDGTSFGGGTSTTSPSQTVRNKETRSESKTTGKQKVGQWSDQQMSVALAAIERGCKVRAVAHYFYIP